MKVLIMAYGLGCVFVHASLKCLRTVNSNSQQTFVCDCLGISHKVSSNSERAAFMMKVSLYAKIQRKYSMCSESQKHSLCQHSFFFLPGWTLISGEYQRVRQREKLGKICERQILSVTP